MIDSKFRPKHIGLQIPHTPNYDTLLRKGGGDVTNFEIKVTIFKKEL